MSYVKTHEVITKVHVNEDAQLEVEIEIDDVLVVPVVLRWSREKTMNLVNAVLQRHGLPPVELVSPTAANVVPEMAPEYEVEIEP